MDRLDHLVTDYPEHRLLDLNRVQDMLAAHLARRRMRGKDGGFRRDHLRAFAQRVEVAEREVRIMGPRNEFLRLLRSSNGVATAANGVRTFVPGWRRGWDSNPRYG